MVFSSLVFLYGFLPLCLGAYFLAPSLKWRNGVLIAFSLVFYAWGEPLWVILLVLSAVVDFNCARFIEARRGEPIAKLGVAFSLFFNLGAIVAFKYSGFLVENLNGLTGLGLAVPAFHLPIGISFYSFQTMSYTIDVYRGKVGAQRSAWDFLLYVSLFPQLVAGPIVRYATVAKEIASRAFSWEDLSAGVGRFALGLGKKVLLANAAGEAVAALIGPGKEALSVLGAWWAMALYAFQIFFDFSGYSDMAIGLGRVFGFRYEENFDYPYASRSATEFWRRWHMSLGSFFRDYLYIPLGGNKRFMARNMLIVWFLTGLWHGPSWNYVAWGLFWGLLILAERGLGALTGRELPRPLGHAYLLVAALSGWALFYFEDLGRAFGHLGAMFGANGLPLADPSLGFSVSQNAFLFVICGIASMPIVPFVRERLKGGRFLASWPARAFEAFGRPLIDLGMLAAATVLLVGKSYNPFLYFRF
jgi:alginate O-acetyltransferase complex protein AlgI